MKFVNPGILYALLLVAIPIIIHLFNLKRYKVVYFTNVRFLRELQEETKKKSVLKHLLVLLSRILAIVFLVLAFARPYIPAQEELVISKQDYVSVFVDNSFSMQAKGTQGELLEVAKNKAAAIFRNYRNTDAFQILTNDFEGVHQRIISKDEAENMLSGIEFSHHHRKLSDIIARQNNLTANFTGEQKFFYIVSDFQKTMFDIDNIPLDTTYKVVLIPVVSEKINNLFIDSLWFETPVKRLNQNITLNVRVKNLSDDYVEKVPAKLIINGEQRALSSFDCMPQSATVLQLPFRINKTGIHNGHVEIIDYPITYDDIMYFSFNVYEHISVLIINERQQNPYLNTLFGNDSAFVLNNVDVSALDYSAFARHNFIILNGFDDVSSGLSGELYKYVENGGHLLLIPGSNIVFEAYNTLLSQFAPIAVSAADTQSLKINYINLRHPLYRTVFDDLPENVLLPEIKLHYTFTSTGNTFAEELLRLQNGRSFLSVYYAGKGQLYLMASPLESAYSGLPLHAIFVPTAYNMALNSVSGAQLYYTLGIEQIVEIPHKQESSGSLYRINATKNDYEFIPQHIAHFSRLSLNVHDQIKEAGTYNVMVEKDEIAGLAFNYDRKESYLDYYDADALKNLIENKGLQNISVIDVTKQTSSDGLFEINKGRLLFKIFVILALVFLAAEVALIRFWK